MLAWIRSAGSQHSFDDYRAALNLMLGLENGGPGPASSPVLQTGFTTTATGGPVPPGAHLKPGTAAKSSGDVSRQKLNEYCESLTGMDGPGKY